MSAFLPRNGGSLMTWASQDLESLVKPSTIDPRADGAIGFKPVYIRAAFYWNCADEDVTFAQLAPLLPGLERLLERQSKCRKNGGVESRAITLSASAIAP